MVFTLDRVQQRLLEQSRTSTFQFPVVERVVCLRLRRADQFLVVVLAMEVLQVFSQESFQPTLEPIAEIPPGAGLQDFLPDQAFHTHRTPASSSMPPAHRDDFWEDEAGGMWMRLPSGRWYFLCSEPEVYWDDPG